MSSSEKTDGTSDWPLLLMCSSSSFFFFFFFHVRVSYVVVCLAVKQRVPRIMNIHTNKIRYITFAFESIQEGKHILYAFGSMKKSGAYKETRASERTNGLASQVKANGRRAREEREGKKSAQSPFRPLIFPRSARSLAFQIHSLDSTPLALCVFLFQVA